MTDACHRNHPSDVFRHSNGPLIGIVAPVRRTRANPLSPLPHRSTVAFLAVFAATVVCAGALMWSLEQPEQAHQRTQVTDIAGDHPQALQRAFELSLSANNTLVALVRQGQGQAPQFVLAFYPGIAAMGLSPKILVQQATPKQGNERLLGFNQLNDPLQRAESARAQNSGQLTLAGPVELVQGGLGVVGSQPVFTKDGHGQEKFWDSTFVTIRLHSVLAAAHFTQLGERGYHYRLPAHEPRHRARADHCVVAPDARDRCSEPVTDAAKRPMDLGCGAVARMGRAGIS